MNIDRDIDSNADAKTAPINGLNRESKVCLHPASALNGCCTAQRMRATSDTEKTPNSVLLWLFIKVSQERMNRG